MDQEQKEAASYKEVAGEIKMEVLQSFKVEAWLKTINSFRAWRNEDERAYAQQVLQDTKSK